MNKQTFTSLLLISIFIFSTYNALASTQEKRTIINLNGTWNIAEGSMDEMPESFSYVVPVPGLVDLSSPDFFEVGIESDRREAFWYYKTFKIDGDIPASAILKINKAKYGTKVYLNGELVGEHLPCFTPGLFDIKPFLKGNNKTNELIIRVGAHMTSVPLSIPNGWDFEKYKYIPGIYDDVEVIMSGYPHIVNIQTAPDIENETVHVQAEIETDDHSPEKFPITYQIKEHTSNIVVAQGTQEISNISNKQIKTLNFDVTIPNCQLWSPDNPSLYVLELETPADNTSTRFGMRSFEFDPITKRAMLNGKPIYMRGTNVCIYRFFEDAERGDLPWNKEWVTKLHKKFQDMHWNSIRYCIGFPPDFWYDIADELGILIQDEFPIWTLGEWPEELKADAIAAEYKEWMRERWNHPCLVIWDAQNESRTEETGKAIQMVRDLDLSNRPWDNGWAEPQAETDPIESHPYFFSKSWKEVVPIDMQEFGKGDGVPYVQQVQQGFDNPLIINEYAWLWLNRDGSTTTLTENVYQSLLGNNSTVEERRETYARYLAAMTEFWRVKRKCAAVMHFCGLGYSRPGGDERPTAGATSDNFIDIKELIYEPHFYKYVKDAFAPVGLMIDIWQEEFKPGETITVPIVLINDTYDDKKGLVELSIHNNKKKIIHRLMFAKIQSLDSTQIEFENYPLPEEPGQYELRASLIYPELNDEPKEPVEEPVYSFRRFEIK